MLIGARQIKWYLFCLFVLGVIFVLDDENLVLAYSISVGSYLPLSMFWLMARNLIRNRSAGNEIVDSDDSEARAVAFIVFVLASYFFLTFYSGDRFELAVCSGILALLGGERFIRKVSTV
ncbi:hypothetical protein [Pandoraea sputorum]|uniref:Uncharacterized protein n=1 Tax=Pandoraea sputorum TaxID=93222 RepID=A0A5E5B0J7_9BURK|nr:hypothetical protein [Pandoraea sputorum]VVE79681.1 hypothetical protein PSP31121_02246 [Pandoraea sputorum]